MCVIGFVLLTKLCNTQYPHCIIEMLTPRQLIEECSQAKDSETVRNLTFWILNYEYVVLLACCNFYLIMKYLSSNTVFKLSWTCYTSACEIGNFIINYEVFFGNKSRYFQRCLRWYLSFLSGIFYGFCLIWILTKENCFKILSSEHDGVIYGRKLQWTIFLKKDVFEILY